MLPSCLVGFRASSGNRRIGFRCRVRIPVAVLTLSAYSASWHKKIPPIVDFADPELATVPDPHRILRLFNQKI